jgi:hypothetical protein
MLERQSLAARLATALRRAPVTLLLGPRQCGKTTLARWMHRRAENGGAYFDLESPVDLATMTEPMSALDSLKGLIVLDEVQRRPDLFPALRVLADRKPCRARFLILGSASPEMLRQSSETLAGRVEIIEMSGFDLQEVGIAKRDRLWIRGGFPPSFLARNEASSLVWRQDFIQTFLERDLPQMGLQLPPMTLRRFWSMVAHYHGQTWNASEIAASLGVSDMTTRRYLDVLSGAYMVRQLPAWFESIKKRQVKAPKIYIRDTGLLHSLLGVDSRRALLSHPKYGASWEGFALEQVLRTVPHREAYFWATHHEAELDLLVFTRGKRWGFELKVKDAPVLTRSMRIALDDLKLDRLIVVYPGAREYRLAPNVTVLPLAAVGQGDF